MKCIFLKLTALAMLATASASGVHASSESDEPSSITPQSLRGSFLDENEDADWWGGWQDLTTCTSNCHCHAGSCDQTECRSNCGCQMGGCKGRPKDGRRPTRNPTRRPTGSSSSSFDEGLEAGRREANKLWRDAGNRCSSAWGDFQNTVDRKIRARGWNTGGNRSFNQGARAGMKEVVVEKEKECFRDSADECVDLGNEAARMIAYDHCGSFGMNSVSKKWRRNCRDAAVDQCRGQVFNQVRDECGSPNTSDLRTLQNKCRNKVLTMIGDRSEDYDYSEDSEDLSVF
ncbi:hypothetical protein QTG54_006203 [Skeletonema marinoi]|uniref:Uncharacterized protein n=1 Tax=Skeletonema marinoi TaxID=267567 RepID=A0AAD8YCE7_9STRA|nr:hypothetical protein QTG54_006203 [Skeletonema marinoi]